MSTPRYRRGQEVRRAGQIDSMVNGSFVCIILVSGLGLLAIGLHVLGVLP